jgi:hypothetical protein
MGIFTTLGHAIGATVHMAWDTWWALVLAFTITGAVELFTTEEQMTEYLGDDEAHVRHPTHEDCACTERLGTGRASRDRQPAADPDRGGSSSSGWASMGRWPGDSVSPSSRRTSSPVNFDDIDCEGATC